MSQAAMAGTASMTNLIIRITANPSNIIGNRVTIRLPMR
jgi:hypothetical protein